MIIEHPINIKPYLRRYLSYHHDTNPFIISEKNRFGIYLINSLRFKNIERNDKRYVIQGGTEKMNIQIKECYSRSFGFRISNWHQYQFNASLLDEFHERMLDFVSHRMTGKKGDIKKALFDFREKYLITENDLSFKTLEKMFEREKYRLTSCKSA